MKFDFGQRVRLTRDLQMPGFKIAQGLAGTVTNIHIQTSVLFDGLTQELAVADNDLEPLNVKSETTTATTSVSPTSGVQGFLPGQRVFLLVVKNIGGQTIPAGTLGTVSQDAPAMSAAWVVFDGFNDHKLIPNHHLALA